MTAYDDHVLNHANVRNYWKLDEASGTTLADSAGADPLTLSVNSGHSTTGGPLSGMGYVDLASKSAYNTSIDLATLQAASGFAFGGWFKNPTDPITLRGPGDWQSNVGAMMFADNRLYYNATIRTMAGVGAFRFGNLPNEWCFVVGVYNTAANSYNQQLWHNGVRETNHNNGAALGAGASRFEVGSYATGTGGVSTSNPLASGLFILDAVPTDAWIEEAYDLFNPNRVYDAYEAYVLSLAPSHFWSLQNDLWPLPGTKSVPLQGTVGSYPAGPNVYVPGVVGAYNNTLALSERYTDVNRNTTAYTYGGWFKRAAGNTSRSLMGNWDGDGTMIHNGDNSTGANNDFAIYHQGLIMQVDPPGGAAFDMSLWHHYMVRWDGTTQTFFIDGEPIASVGRTAVLGSCLALNVGGYNVSNTNAPEMTAAYCGWWENVALTDAQIKNLYTALPALWRESTSPMVMG